MSAFTSRGGRLGWSVDVFPDQRRRSKASTFVGISFPFSRNTGNAPAVLQSVQLEVISLSLCLSRHGRLWNSRLCCDASSRARTPSPPLHLPLSRKKETACHPCHHFDAYSSRRIMDKSMHVKIIAGADIFLFFLLFIYFIYLFFESFSFRYRIKLKHRSVVSMHRIDENLISTFRK